MQEVVKRRAIGKHGQAWFVVWGSEAHLGWLLCWGVPSMLLKYW